MLIASSSGTILSCNLPVRPTLNQTGEPSVAPQHVDATKIQNDFKNKKIEQFLSYHNGDGHPEETMMSKLCKHYYLSQWDIFRATYYYAMCYNLVDPFRMLKVKEPIPCGDIDFVSDRRWVGQVPSRYYKMLAELTMGKYHVLNKCHSTQAQCEEVRQWYYFGRYAAYLFLECWNYLYPASIGVVLQKRKPLIGAKKQSPPQENLRR